MPIWPQSTVELEQNQWHWLNVFLATTNVAGVPAATAGVLSSQAAYGYRYEGPTGFTARVLDSFTFVVTTGYDYSGSATGSSDLTMRVTAAAGSLPPTNGRVTANNGVDAPETFNYVSYNESTGVITLSTALTANYTAGATTLTRIDWFDAGTGYYSLLITPTEIANTGTFTVRVGNLAGSTFDVFGQNVEVVPYTGINTSAVPFPPPICTLFGHVVDLQGTAVQNISVYARMLATPVMGYGEAFMDTVVTAKTDSNGFFQVTIAQQTTVEVVIPDIGYKRTIIVPTTTQANVFELA